MNRCYGNPVPRRNSHDNSTDMNSFPFIRHHFLRSGFEVIDCPPLTAQLKNSADIRIVMDIRDILTHDTFFDEFIILSGDADFTPVLHRLRAHARRTIVFANDSTAQPYTAISDGEIRESSLIQLLTRSQVPAQITSAQADFGTRELAAPVRPRSISTRPAKPSCRKSSTSCAARRRPCRWRRWQIAPCASSGTSERSARNGAASARSASCFLPGCRRIFTCRILRPTRCSTPTGTSTLPASSRPSCRLRPRRPRHRRWLSPATSLPARMSPAITRRLGAIRLRPSASPHLSVSPSPAIRTATPSAPIPADIFSLEEVQWAQRYFNESPFTSRMRDVRRSLGKPRVNFSKVAGMDPRVLVTICWDIVWYQYLVELRREGLSGDRVSLYREGMELDELNECFKDKNASINDDGRVDASELEVQLLSDPTVLITEMPRDEERALEDATEEIWDQHNAPEFKWDD